MNDSLPAFLRFLDDFDDGALDPRWIEMNYNGGTVSETSGVARLTVPAGSGFRTAAVVLFEAWFDGHIEIDIAAADFSLPAAGHVEYGLGFLGAVIWAACVRRDSTAANWRFVIEKKTDDGDEEMYSEELTELPSRIFVNFYYAGGGDFGFVASAGAQLVRYLTAEPLAGCPFLKAESTGDGAGYCDFDNFHADSQRRVDRVSPPLIGCHLAPVIRVYGDGFGASFGEIEFNPTATLDGEACDVTVISPQIVELALPLVDTPGLKALVFCPFINSPPLTLNLRATDAGYRILRALLAPDRYTPKPENLFNVNLAAWGWEFDLLEAALCAATDEEFYPETADALIDRHERKYGLPVATGDSLAERRARCVLRALWRNDSSRLALRAIARAVLPDAELAENFPYSVFGRFCWQYQVIEDAPNQLSPTTRAVLQRALETSGPFWTQPEIGAAGFVVDESAVDQDFVDEE
jgi:uncharacterized protein YmfQ (DUF2313 family)